jgi:DNA-binding NarL/FixJ family response regulator
MELIQPPDPETVARLAPLFEGWTLGVCTASGPLRTVFAWGHQYPRWQAASIAEFLALPIPEDTKLMLVASDDLPEGSVLDLITPLRQRFSPEQLRVVLVLEDRIDAHRLRAFSDAGVEGLCREGAVGNGLLLNAILFAARGGRMIDPQFTLRMVNPEAAARAAGAFEALSDREREMLRQLCLGFNSGEIASRLGLRDDTVRRCLSDAHQKIGVRDRSQAIGWSLCHGLLRLQDLEQVYAPLPPSR